jgi:hypothetical protein
MAVAFLSKDSQAVGSAMFLPWVALLAFEFGVTAGSVAAVVAFALFLLPASEQGSALTFAFVVGRLASFLLIGAGVGVLGTRLRASEVKNRRLVEGLPLAVDVESAEAGADLCRATGRVDDRLSAGGVACGRQSLAADPAR